MAQQPPRGRRPPHYRGFMITLIHTTLFRTPLDEGSARRRDLYQLSVLLYQIVAMYQRHYDVIC